jgi:transposase
VHEEFKRRGVTLMILWEEHAPRISTAHGYSRFCELYGEWRRRLSPTMRQTHVAGDKLFVDRAGDTVPIIEPCEAQLLGATGRTPAAFPTQRTSHPNRHWYQAWSGIVKSALRLQRLSLVPNIRD